MDDLLGTLRAAAEPTRLRLLALCARNDLTVSELTQILRQSQPRISRHLKLLCDSGLLDRFPEGTNAFYRATGDGRRAGVARFLVDAIPADDPTLAHDLGRLEVVKRRRAETAAQYFKKNAARWDGVRSLYVDEEKVEGALLKLLPAGMIGDLLDVGTGTGRILQLLSGRVERAVGIDLSRDMLGVARANLEGSDLQNCLVRHGNMYDLPWPAASFDVVTLHLVLHYAEDPADAIAESARVLRPAGRMVIVDFAAHDVEELRHAHAHRWLGFDDAKIQSWFRDGGLTPETPERLKGDPLTVCLWPAVRRPHGNMRAGRGRETERAAQ